jgi:hypothetical protein
MMKDLETLLGDLEDAQRAGVFSRTPPHALNAALPSQRTRFYLVSPKWAVAATLILTAGVWSMMFRTKVSEVRDQARSARMAVALDLQTQLASCTAGPIGAMSGSCARVDFDRDGDVDLLDYSRYQREFIAAAN